MKKLYLMALCTLTIISVPAALFAAAATITVASPVFTQATGATGPATLAVTPSPNVEISVWSTTTAYTMTSANIVTNKTNGSEYGATNLSTGYAQRTKTTDADTGPAATTGEVTLPGTGWTWMGGS
ncbi:MAG: hypothetical protein JZU65_23485 [Chlorobium sp.]|nr:hypothetical protein [Chlorobium sp.]